MAQKTCAVYDAVMEYKETHGKLPDAIFFGINRWNQYLLRFRMDTKGHTRQHRYMDIPVYQMWTADPDAVWVGTLTKEEPR